MLSKFNLSPKNSLQILDSIIFTMSQKTSIETIISPSRMCIPVTCLFINTRKADQSKESPGHQ